MGDTEFKPLDPMGIIAAEQPKPEPAAAEARSTDTARGLSLRTGIIESAEALGVSPVDLATAISYETAGTFDAEKRGPTTQWGQHRGLIQFGQPQAQKYGVDWNNPVGSQLGKDGAVVKYLRDTGVRPGMGLLDIYSAINAGGVGRYNRSDAGNGGAPGTVADKVNNQMEGHRAKAMALLGGDFTPSTNSGGNGPRQTGAGTSEKRHMPEEALAKEPSKTQEVASAALGIAKRGRQTAALGLPGARTPQARSPNALEVDTAAEDEIAALDAQIATMQQAAFRDPRAAAQLAALQTKRATLQASA